MNTTTDPSRGRQQHADQWIMVDARLQLLSVGSALYSGSSPRGPLDITTRHLLVPRMRATAADGLDRSDTARFDEARWQIRVIPVLGPVCRQPLAVLGCYGRDATRFPSPPLVGSWEWRVTPPGPDQEMRTYWSESLFEVYGIPSPGKRETSIPYWEAPQWLDELILDEDRADMRKLLDEFLTTTSDALFLHTYGVRNPSTGEAHKLRFAGRSYVTDPGPPWWFRGISTRIDHLQPCDNGSSSTREFLNAAFTLTAVPLCAVDAAYEHVYMTTQNFAELGIDLPPHRHLPTMCHPDDLPQLRNFLGRAAVHPSAEAEPVRVRFAADGGWIPLTITGTGVRLSPNEEPHHVLCRVARADP